MNNGRYHNRKFCGRALFHPQNIFFDIVHTFNLKENKKL